MMILSENNFQAWKLPWVSVLTWVVFLSTRLINPHHALCTLIIKVTILLRRGHSRNSRWQKPPTHIYPLEPSGSVHYCVESLPFLTKAIGLITETPAAYPQHLYNKLVFNAYCGSHIPAMQFPFYSSAIFKKTQTKRHTLLFLNRKASLHQISLLPRVRAQCIVSVTIMLAFFLLFIPSQLFPPKLPLL